MPPFLAQFLVAAALCGLTFLVSLPVTVTATHTVDALDLFLLVFSLVNLRLAWSGANHVSGGRAPAWFIGAGLLLAAFITFRTMAALSFAPGVPPGA